MHNARIDAAIMYPTDGRGYDVAFSGDYDVHVVIENRGRIELQFRSKMRGPDFTTAIFTVPQGIAEWLGLALFRASIQKEPQQHVEIRSGKFPDNRPA